MPESMLLQHSDGLRIPWWAAEQAYRGYTKFYPGSAAMQSLEKLNQRGGFGVAEFACLYNGHRPGHRSHDDGDACIAKAFMDVGVGSDRT